MLDNASHRLGSRAFITLQHCLNPQSTDLRSAAFWLGVRQEVFYAIANQKATLLSFEMEGQGEEGGEEGEGAWANRMVLHCVGVVNFCFGTQGSTGNYDELVAYCEEWARGPPASYRPVFFAEDDGQSGFPMAMFLSSAAVIGLQHYHLASMLLRAHDPRVPRVGLARNVATKAVDADLKRHARLLCGLALSNGE